MDIGSVGIVSHGDAEDVSARGGVAGQVDAVDPVTRHQVRVCKTCHKVSKVQGNRE